MLAGIIGTVFVGVLILIVVGLYLYRQMRRKKLIREAIAFDPTFVDRLCKEQEQDEKRSSLSSLFLTGDLDSGRYPNNYVRNLPKLPQSPGSTLRSRDRLSLPESAFQSEYDVPFDGRFD
jgi:hypothetical protein